MAFYKHNKAESLEKDLFENPTSEYRGAPFWVWNCKLDKSILAEQIEVLKKWDSEAFIYTQGPVWQRNISAKVL